MCEILFLRENAMLKARPELIDEWDFEKNDELGLNVYEMTKGNTLKAWWLCPECKSSYDARISNRVHGRKCPYCRGLKVNHTNSLVSLYPELAKEWHPTKNGDFTPNNITIGNDSQEIWWLGECKHEWTSIVRSRVKGSRCPYCSHNPKTLKGVNDMWTTNPQMASWLLNAEDGHKYSKGSTKKLNWKCPNCNSVIKNKTPNYIRNKGYVPCPLCGDGFSYSEKLIYNLLIDNDIDFEIEKKFDWSFEYRYDFYIPKLDWIIESHGLQHYEEVIFGNSDNRDLKHRQEVDARKLELARNNNIKKYIVLDSRVSEINYITNSIMKSELREVIKKIDAKTLEQRIYKSIVIEACELWNKGLSLDEIAERFKIHISTVQKYMKKGAKMGVCDYSGRKSQLRSNLKKGGRIRRIVQLDKDESLIKIWDSLTEIEKKLNINMDYVSMCCKKKRESYKDFIWMYEIDYKKTKEEK